MYGIGPAEIIVLLIVFFPAILTLILRKFFPNRLWIGILLCAISGTVGQFYIKGGLIYATSIAIVYLILISIIGLEALIVTIFMNIISTLIMYYRFLKKKGIENG